jgi:glycosyltransferase involved in cell wall biosynthesis
MIEKYLVSVVIPTFNRGHLIGESIKSVIDQSHSRWEIIVVDDGSTDDTELVIQRFNDNRIQYYRFQHTGSISSLRNYGINYAKGYYISFLDSDDLWLPNKLEFQLALFERFPQAAFACAHGEQFGDGAVIPPALEMLFVGDMLKPQLVEERFVLYPTTFIFKKEVLDSTGALDEAFSGGESEFILRIAAKFQGIFSGEKLARMRKHKQNVSLERELVFSKEHLYLLGKFLKLGIINAEEYRIVSSKQCYKLGLLYQRRMMFHEATISFGKFVRMNPFFYKGYLRILQSVALRVIH